MSDNTRKGNYGWLGFAALAGAAIAGAAYAAYTISEEHSDDQKWLQQRRREFNSERSEENTYIFDAQGFWGKRNDLIPKEVGILNVNSGEMTHFLVDAPYKWEELPEEAKNTNEWLTENFHGLTWNSSGSVSFNRLLTILEKELRNAKVLCAGERKAKFLRDHDLADEIIQVKMTLPRNSPGACKFHPRIPNRCARLNCIAVQSHYTNNA